VRFKIQTKIQDTGHRIKVANMEQDPKLGPKPQIETRLSRTQDRNPHRKELSTVAKI